MPNEVCGLGITTTDINCLSAHAILDLFFSYY